MRSSVISDVNVMRGSHHWDVYGLFCSAASEALRRGRNFVAGVVCVWRGDTVSACVRAVWLWP